MGIPGFELLPDGSFHPDEPVTRAGYARVSEGVLTLLTADPSLSTRYGGETSRFPDVRGDSYAYNAIAVSVERGPCPPGVEIAPFWITAINSLTNVTDDPGWG